MSGGGSIPATGDSQSNTAITTQDSFSIDAFGRWRVSNPETLFDSKNIFNDPDIADNLENLPLVFDNQETSGSGTSTAFVLDEATQTITVGATTAGTRVRQTKQRFNYQPGKSQLSFITFNLKSLDDNITKRVGYFDDNNGLLLQTVGSTVSLVRRTNTSGSPVNNAVEQASWNLDPMDGSGPSGVTLDFTKTQILIIDFEWLGVGRVRMGFVVDGLIYYVHEFLNANNLDVVYMSTPNLPVRYEISNDGSGATSDLDCICCSVISEGGVQDMGQIRYVGSTSATNANAAGTVYAILGIRLKSEYIGQTIKTLSVALSEITSGKELQWFLKFNPSVAGTFTYSDLTNSAIQSAQGDTANTVTGGIDIAGGFFNSSNRGGEVSIPLISALSLGSTIAGVVDEIVLCCTPLTGSANCDVFGGLTWRELT